MLTVKIITNIDTDAEEELLYQCERVEFTPLRTKNRGVPGISLINVNGQGATHQFGCNPHITKAFVMNDQGATVSRYTF